MSINTHSHTCTYLGPEYDSRTWYRQHPGQPTPFCGHAALEGKSYCRHHYPLVYSVGSALRRRPKAEQVQDTFEDLLQMIRDIAEEIELEEEA